MIRRRVGIFVAMCAEARALTGTTLPVRTAVPVADDALLWIGGVGAAAAEQGCDALVRAGANALASIGTAAGLAPDCVPGGLVLPRQVVRAGHPPMPVDGAWREALNSALEAAVPVANGPLAEAQAVLDPSAKHALHGQTGAVSADMESAAVAAFSMRTGVPVIVLRAISDGCSDQVPRSVVQSVDDFGRPDYGRLLLALARRPGEFEAMLRLAAGFRAACRTLRLVARTSGLRFCCPE